MKNYLKKTKQIKAPLNWKSSPNSPSTQLAYVTQPEIDLLVKANLHNSMNGKPNVGPKGIISLDGMDVDRKIKGKKQQAAARKTVKAATIDTSTRAGQDKKQKFRDRTGSKVISDREKKGREALGREEGKIGKLSDTEYQKKYGETKSGAEVTTDTTDNKKEKESQDNSNDTAQWLTNWWANNEKGVGYKERKNIFTGKLWGSQEAVTAKIAAKLNKGYYKIVKGPKGEPLIIHASTGTPVNPYTGNIISTQTRGDQGGAYQNEMARITGIDPKNAGVFSKEYQRGHGLAVSNMKPEHALRYLMKKKPEAFEQFFLDSKKKGFNPFSASFIKQGFGAIMSMITGPDALKVGNNLERVGWGKAIKNEDGDYTIKLTEKGADNWAKSFNFDNVSLTGHDGKEVTFSGFTSPEAITKDKDKGWLSDLLGTKKFPEAPINLDNLIDQGGYQTEGQTGQTMGFAGSGLIPQKTQVDIDQGFPIGTTGINTVPIAPQDEHGNQLYGWMPPTDLRDPSEIPGTPPSQYPQFTPEGYKISAYNPSMNYGNRGGGGQGGGQGGGGGQNQDQDTTTQPGPLTFDVYGRPVTYDYTGGPEQIYLGGGYKRDGQYIGSPYGFSKGGIANFKPYGY